MAARAVFPEGFPEDLPDDDVLVLSGADGTDLPDEADEVLGVDDSPYLTEVWIWVVLTLMMLVCFLILLVCVILRRRVARGEKVDLELDLEAATLPSYTLVSGLPTYDEALDQLQRMRQLRRSSSAQKAIETAVAAAMAAGNLVAVRRLQNMRQLSVGELLKYSYRSNSFDKS